MRLIYQAHVAGTGWQDPVEAGQIAGTVGESRQMEAYRINIENADGIGVECFAKPFGMDWSAGNVQGEDVGTTGMGIALEAVKMGLFGPKAEAYDIWYRVHISNIGWTGFVRNGEVAGTAGSSGNNRIEAIQIFITEKDRTWLGIDDMRGFLDMTPPPAPQQDKAQNLLNVARSQLGYVSGSSTDSVYGRVYSGAGAGNWCCFFARWCADSAGIAFPKTGYCPTVVTHAKSTGRWTSQPKPGYFVLYDFNYNGVSDHIGIVESVINGGVIAIEGNTGNPVGVYRKTRTSGILGYFNPF